MWVNYLERIHSWFSDYKILFIVLRTVITFFLSWQWPYSHFSSEKHDRAENRCCSNLPHTLNTQLNRYSSCSRYLSFKRDTQLPSSGLSDTNLTFTASSTYLFLGCQVSICHLIGSRTYLYLDSRIPNLQPFAPHTPSSVDFRELHTLNKLPRSPLGRLLNIKHSLDSFLYLALCGPSNTKFNTQFNFDTHLRYSKTYRTILKLILAWILECQP